MVKGVHFPHKPHWRGEIGGLLLGQQPDRWGGVEVILTLYMGRCMEK